MCTVSVLRGPWREADAPAGLLFRVVVNRDERRTRAAARPPAVDDYDGIGAVHPVDPDGGGTWVAASAAGLVMVLLNGPAAPGARRSGPSRGLVIPRLLRARGTAEAMALLSATDARRYAPFRLLILASDGVVDAVGGARGLSCTRTPPFPRLVRTSSSVRHAEVHSARTRLFTEMVARGSRRSQDAFHSHRWVHDGPASVLMERADARTVSRTVVEVFADRVGLEYRPLPGLTRTETGLARRR